MSFIVAAVLASLLLTVPAPDRVQASARVAVEILRTVTVRQAIGIVVQDNTPQHQVIRRDGAELIEFQ